MTAAFTPIVGHYAVIKGWGNYVVETITRVTPKLVFTQHGTWRARQRKHGDLTAQFPDPLAAEQLAQSLNGALGQYNERCRKARKISEASYGAAKEAFDRTANELIAKATGASQ